MSLWGVVPLVIQVSLMHDGGDSPEDRIGKVVAAQDSLEAAVARVMRKFRTDDVERGGVGGNFGRVGNEDEFRLGIDMAADQPSTGRPVDMDGRAGRPSHGVSSRPPDGVPAGPAGGRTGLARARPGLAALSARLAGWLARPGGW